MIHATFRRPLGGRQLMSKQGKDSFPDRLPRVPPRPRDQVGILLPERRQPLPPVSASPKRTWNGGGLLCESAASPAYRRRLTKTLKKFYAFATQKLDVPQNPLVGVQKKGREQTSSRSRIRW